VANRFRYNPQRLLFEPVKKGFWYYVRTLGPYVGFTLVMSVVFVLVFYSLYDSPRTSLMKNQNRQLSASIQQYDQQIDSMGGKLTALETRNKQLYRDILNADPIELDSQDKQAPDSVVALFEGKSYDDLETRVNALEGRVSEQNATQAYLVEMAKSRKEELAFIPSIRPLPSEVLSGFGVRRHPIFKKDFDHRGIDFRADLGSPIYATADGWVKTVGSPDKGLGTMVIINHRNGYETRFGHLSKAAVRVGQRLKRGDIIGYSGDSGLCKGPHLYYEIRKGGGAIDPIDYFFHDLSPTQLIDFRRKASQYNESMG
jgi:murein DD-endopeptidase MepM/ murein hydrolase activator NlpD